MTCINCGGEVENLIRGLCQKQSCYGDLVVRANAPLIRPTRFWTSLELREVGRLRFLGYGIATIARKLGRTEDSVTHVMARIKRKTGQGKVRGWR